MLDAPLEDSPEFGSSTYTAQQLFLSRVVGYSQIASVGTCTHVSIYNIHIIKMKIKSYLKINVKQPACPLGQAASGK